MGWINIRVKEFDGKMQVGPGDLACGAHPTNFLASECHVPRLSIDCRKVKVEAEEASSMIDDNGVA